LARAETALFLWRVHELKADRLKRQIRSYETDLLGGFSSLTVIADKASHSEATDALAQAEYEQHRDEVLLGRALDADAKEGDAFAKLARYERSIEQSLFRTLNELRQMQDERRNPRSSSIPDAVTLDANDIR
jgi:histidinol dehydrogenase